MTEPALIRRIEDLPPAHRDIVLPGLRMPIRCEAMNPIEMLRRQKALPGLPPPMTPDEREAAAGRGEDPALVESVVYPTIIVGCFLLNENDEPVRPTFTIEEEPGRISLRRVPQEDVLLMINTLQQLAGWSGGPADSLGFPDDAGRRGDGVGAVGAVEG
jgi:hypothetical protein